MQSNCRYSSLQFARLFVKLPRSGVSEVTFCCLRVKMQPVYYLFNHSKVAESRYKWLSALPKDTTSELAS